MEDKLSDQERNAILSKVFTSVPKKDVSTPKSEHKISESTSDLSQKSFGDLLEESIAIREELDQEDTEKENRMNEARERAIGISRFDILKDFHL